MKHIAIVTSNYPSEDNPQRGVFVQQLVIALSRTGLACSVIAPTAIFNKRHGKPGQTIETVNYGGLPVTIYRDRYLSLSDINFMKFNTLEILKTSFEMAVKRSLQRMVELPDFLYGHFLFPSGMITVKLGTEMNIPAFVAVGESNPGKDLSKNKRLYEEALKIFNNVHGIVAVSTPNANYCINKLNIPADKVGVFPNSIDRATFYPREKKAVREKYGFPIDNTIVAFVGHFNERKGPHRLLQAVDGNDNIKVILVGKGDMRLESKNIIFKGSAEHSQIPEILSAADIFVLPTLAEGSCNAIVEALACGLPVISSKGDFNDDILAEGLSLRVDPLNIAEIKKAILCLTDNPGLRLEMSKNALEHCKHLDIEVRADKIKSWMLTMLENSAKGENNEAE